jgi:hypothetical protein
LTPGAGSAIRMRIQLLAYSKKQNCAVCQLVPKIKIYNERTTETRHIKEIDTEIRVRHS